MKSIYLVLPLLFVAANAGPDVSHGSRPGPQRRAAATLMLASGDEPQDDVMLAQLVERLDLIAVGWEPAPMVLDTVDVWSVAEACAEAGLDRGSTSPFEDAVLLLSLAYWEGARFAFYVDDGNCNDPVWRSSSVGVETMRRWGDCDGGRAHSLWQIHPIEDRSSPLWPMCSQKEVDGSRLGAARCALAIAVSSMDSFGSLAGYTGERLQGPHPAADKRLEWARRASQ